MTNRIRIKTTKNEFGTRRNFAGLPFKDFEVMRSIDPSYFLAAVVKKVSGLRIKRLENTHIDLGFRLPDLYHFFNTVSYTRKPWIVTFETALPRWETDAHIGYDLLARPSCKKIIAISQAAFDIQLNRMSRYPERKKIVQDKLIVAHPPQSLYIKNWLAKQIDLDSEIVFTFVGRDFFRKGGKEILLVCDQLLQAGKKIKLNVVSKLAYGDYATKSTQKDFDEAVSLLEKNRAHIQHYRELPNDKVIDLFVRSHVALLPTYADTYGYSVLEAQACGCPVITSDVRSLPEINSDSAGWILTVPKNNERDAILQTQVERESYSRTIQEQLFRTICQILDNPQQIPEKGEKSLQRISENHDPEKHMELLESIYYEALA